MYATYYKVHGGRLTVAEYWRICSSWQGFLYAVALKPFGGFRFKFSVPRPEELRIVRMEELPAPVRERLRGPVEGFERAGLELAFYDRAQVLERHRIGVTAVLPGDGGETIGTVVVVNGRPWAVELNCVTHFTDGRACVTTTARQKFRPQPHITAFRYPGLSPEELCERHRENLARMEAAGHFPTRITREQLPRVIVEAQQRFIDFHAARGVFVPMTEAEIDRLRGGRRAGGVSHRSL